MTSESTKSYNHKKLLQKYKTLLEFGQETRFQGFQDHHRDGCIEIDARRDEEVLEALQDGLKVTCPDDDTEDPADKLGDLCIIRIQLGYQGGY